MCRIRLEFLHVGSHLNKQERQAEIEKKLTGVYVSDTMARFRFLLVCYRNFTVAIWLEF